VALIVDGIVMAEHTVVAALGMSAACPGTPGEWSILIWKE
jgi:hypothetical protein